MMDLEELRESIDEIDNDLVKLFDRRMDISAEIAVYKKENKLPVHDPARERQKLHELTGRVRKGRESYITALYSLLFELSRTEQERILNPESELADTIQNAIKDTDRSG